MAFNVPDDLTCSVDLDEVKRALEILIPPGHTFELRALPSARSLVTRDIVSALNVVPSMATGTGLYYTINPVRPDLKGAASNADVLERWWLLIDVDSIRPQPVPPATDISATDGEKAESGKLAGMIRLDLKSRGCPDPVIVDSGNGYQLLYRVSLPNDPLAHKWVSATLKKLADLYNTATARVDISVHNAGRIARLPGTWNRKGPATPDRPHRMARLLSVPDHCETVSVEVLRKFAGPDTPEPSAEPRIAAWTVPPVGTAGDPSVWFRKAVEHEAGGVAMAPAGDRHNALRAAARTLAGYLHHGFITAADITAALKVAGERAGLDQKDINETIKWGLENGQANPLPWPTKLSLPPARHAPQQAGGPARDPVTGSSGREYKTPLVVRCSDVTPQKIDWLWLNRIPYGFLTLFAGRTKVGKSFVTLDIAARVSAGEEIPFSSGDCFAVASCLIISEDSQEYVLTPRLMDAGANRDLIYFMSWEAMASYTLADIEMLEDSYVKAGSPRLIVIDPPTNFLGGKDEHKNAEVRGVLMGVSIWAMKHKVAVILITHCNKGSKKDMAAIDRVIGSIAWASTTRIAHIFGPDPDEDGRNVFVPLGTNIGKNVAGLSYRITEEGEKVKVEWIGDVELNADDMMAGTKSKPRRVVASEWLIERFREKREWPSDELFRAAKEAGLSRDAVFEAKNTLDLPRARKDCLTNGDTQWVWWVPPDWPFFDQK